MRPAVYCLLLRIGIPNENHDDTEQISDTINLVNGYRIRTNDVVRATCIRGVRATAVCVISNTEYTRSISTTSTTAIILLYQVCTVRVCTSSLYHRTGMYWAAYCLDAQNNSCRLKMNQSSRLTIEWVRTHEYTVWKDKKWPSATSTAYDWCTYQLSSRYYNLLLVVRIFRAGFVLIIEWSWHALRNRGPSSGLSAIFSRSIELSNFESIKKYIVQKIRTRHTTGDATWYIRVLVYARPKNEIWRTPQQYPVGEDYSSINNSMHAEESCRDTSALQPKKAV